MNEIEIKIAFENNLVSCEITQSGNITKFEELSDNEQVKVCNALVQFYMLFFKAIKGGQDD